MWARAPRIFQSERFLHICGPPCELGALCGVHLSGKRRHQRRLHVDDGVSIASAK